MKPKRHSEEKIILLVKSPYSEVLELRSSVKRAEKLIFAMTYTKTEFETWDDEEHLEQPKSTTCSSATRGVYTSDRLHC